MTEDALIVAMEFYETNFFIMTLNPADAEKASGAIASTFWG